MERAILKELRTLREYLQTNHWRGFDLAVVGRHEAAKSDKVAGHEPK